MECSPKSGHTSRYEHCPYEYCPYSTSTLYTALATAEDWHEAQHDLAAPTGLHRCITRVAQQRSLLKHTRRSSTLPLVWPPACPGVKEIVLTGQDATINNADKPQAKFDDVACVHPDEISSCAHMRDQDYRVARMLSLLLTGCAPVKMLQSWDAHTHMPDQSPCRRLIFDRSRRHMQLLFATMRAKVDLSRPHLEGVRVHALLHDGKNAASNVREAVRDVPALCGLALVI